MASFLAFFPVAEALLSIAISSVLFSKWWKTGDKSTKFWAFAFFFHFMSYLIAGFFVSRLVVLQIVQYFLLQFARQTFESLLFLSVYFGIINLLTTKRSLTFTLPFLFFLLQELTLVYFDFFLKNLRMADQLHIVFFDIPFNILVALLFWRYYCVAKKKFALLIAGGWLLYAFFVPIFFYTEGNILLYTISLSHMVVMFAGFVLLYESPTGQSILEIMPAVEKRLSTAMKYQLKPGKTYLIENPSKAYDIFMDAVLHGIRGMIISRTSPPQVQQKYELAVTPILWLTHVQTALPTVDPSELEQMDFLIEKFVHSAKAQALTEGEAPIPEKKEEQPVEKKPAPSPIEKPPLEKPPEEKKPEEAWKQKMKETIAEVAGKKPIVLGEELGEKPLKEAVKEVEKAGVAVEIKRGKMIVFGEETPSQKNQTIPSQTVGQNSQASIPLSTIPITPQQPSPQQPVPPPQTTNTTNGSHAPQAPDIKPRTSDLSEKPLKELITEAQKTGESLEIKGKPGDKVQVEIKEVPRRGKMLILGDDNKGDEKKDAKTKASFILAVGDVRESGGLNKSILLIDGLEYLITNNSFTAVLHLLQTMKDKISLGESMLLLPIDPKCIDPKEMALLQQEFETYVEEKE